MNKRIVKELGLAASSFALCILAVVAGAKLYAKWLDIPDSSFRYENRLNMWRLEPTIGFVNKPNFSSYCFGNVRVQTNERGFRGTRPTPVAKRKGVTRIVGLGDSVMWGTVVNEKDSILGFLEKKLNYESSYEVINAGVVGYSTLQELVFLEKYVLPLKPDVVLVNYCGNDLLPTEDPFKNVRRIYIRYLNHLLEGQGLSFTPEEKGGIKTLIRMFDSAGHVWKELSKFDAKSPKLSYLTRKVFIEMPIVRMAGISREAGVRLIYVFIPSKRNNAQYVSTADKLKKLLVENGAEFVDVQSALIPDKKELAKQGHTGDSWLAWVWPSELKQILKLRNIQKVHSRDKFIDSSHPTIKGNEIIAGHIYRYLTETSNTDETEVLE
jgi:lysophospholipase L1-like esterase